MIAILAAALGMAPVCIPMPASASAPAVGARSVVMLEATSRETLRETWDAGIAFDEFLARAEGRKELWHDNWGVAAVPDALLGRARSLTGTWHILAVAIDACSDSVNSIPYVAKLADLAPGIDMRIVDSKRGRAIMEAHRTKDGRAATPTLLVLNDSFEEVGCWVERPVALQEWYAAKQAEGVATSEITRQKMEWYKEHAGREILQEVVAMVEAAANGGRFCPSDASGGRAP
jgi:Thioredoxin